MHYYKLLDNLVTTSEVPFSDESPTRPCILIMFHNSVVWERKVGKFGEKTREARLRWYGHLRRKDDVYGEGC